MWSKITTFYLLILLSTNIVHSQENQLPKPFIEYFTKEFQCPQVLREGTDFSTPLNKIGFGGMDTIKISFNVENGKIKDLKMYYDIPNVFVNPYLKQFITKYDYANFENGNYSFDVYFLILDNSGRKNIDFDFCLYKENAFWSIATKKTPLVGE